MAEIFLILSSIDSKLHYYFEIYGVAIYVLLFLVIYCKTAFVVLTFLPGDTTVFASGTFAAIGELNLWILAVIFIVATILGDSQNYFIGKYIAHLHLERQLSFKLISEKSVSRAKEFLTDYGKVAIMFSRFVPLMRTSVPFVAGYSGSEYPAFVSFNLIGSVIWTTVWLGAGLILGNIKWVDNNLFLTLLIVSCTAFIPALFGFRKLYLKKSHPRR